MRIRELSLAAYGPFTSASLDFSAPVLHVVFGRNEAGKSTALRAITGLLFGIDTRTPDAHLHAMKDLRVGATLEGERGEILQIVRRKGNTNTLLDKDDRPLDEAVLRRMLGGASEEMWKSMFGLDHETLRKGAQALLLGKGDVGESLFGASVGGEVHEVLRALTAETDALFAGSASATRPPLNAAIRAFADAQKRVRALSESTSFATQQAGLDEANAERARCAEERRELKVEQARISRARAVRPLAARRALSIANRAKLGDVAPLKETAPREREDAQRAAADATLKEERLRAEIEELEARRAALVVPDSLVEREEVIEELRAALARYRAATQELPRAKSELREHEEDARILLRRARPDAAFEQASTSGSCFGVDVAAHERVKKLSHLAARLEEKAANAHEALATKRASLDDARATREGAGGIANDTTLRHEVARAQARGDLEDTQRRARASVERLADTARARVAALGLVDLAVARTLPVPPPESVERFALRWAALDRDDVVLRERREALLREAAKIDHDVDALQRGGAVPSEEGLLTARARRSEEWERAVAAWKKGTKPTAATTGAFTDAVEAADAMADALRRDADRAAQLATLHAQRTANATATARLTSDEQVLALAREEASREWRALWAAIPVEPLPPVEMRGWLEKHAKAVVAIEELRAAEITARGVDEEIAELGASLRDALDGAGERTGKGESLSALVARGAERARALEDEARAAKERRERVAILEREIERASADAAAHTAALADWRREWGDAVAAIGLTKEASPEVATKMLEDLTALERHLGDAGKTRKRVDVIEEEIRAFEASVTALTREHAPELEGETHERAAAALVKRFTEGRDAATERRQIDGSLKEKREALRAEEAHRRGAESRLDALMRAAAVTSLPELEIAEQRAEGARELEKALGAVEEQLAEIEHDAHVDALAALDFDALEARSEEVEEKLEEVERRDRGAERSIVSIEQGFEQMRRESAAAIAATDAQESLARVRTHAERYMRMKLATVVLSREIERYREKNQGPILARASALMQRMTLGAFAGLKVGYDERDRPTLRCVRRGTSAHEVDIEGLSDGTRDQLYLSLRLATLERYAEANAPMPLVVDDILVHFDDERARAALEALGEVAKRTQVLLFTHHARVKDLAREALGEGVNVQSLSSLARDVA